MDIRFNKINLHHGVISITLHEADYRSTVEKQIKHYAQHVPLKGFRLGAVPLDLVKRLYGPSILAEELNKVALASLKNYIAQECIPIFIEPLLITPPQEIDFKNQSEFTFSYEVGLMEKRSVELGPHISVTEFEINRVDNKQVDEFLEGLQMVHGQAVHLEESTQDAILYGTFTDGTGRVNLAIRVSVMHLPDHLREALVGLRVGHKVMLTEEMLENHFPALLGIDFGAFASFKRNKDTWPASFVVNRIARVTPAPIEPALFDLVLGKGVADSENAFREAIAGIILFDKRTEARYAFYENLREELFKYNRVDLPDAFLKRWLVVNNPGARLEEVEDYYATHEQDLKWELLLGNIVSQNDLAVTPSDVVDEAKRVYVDYAKNNGLQFEPGDSNMHEGILSFLQSSKGNHYFKLHERLSRDRAVDFIKKHISVVTQTVTAEQFDARK